LYNVGSDPVLSILYDLIIIIQESHVAPCMYSGSFHVELAVGEDRCATVDQEASNVPTLNPVRSGCERNSNRELVPPNFHWKSSGLEIEVDTGENEFVMCLVGGIKQLDGNGAATQGRDDSKLSFAEASCKV
jgi:hypothetical protein